MSDWDGGTVAEDRIREAKWRSHQKTLAAAKAQEISNMTFDVVGDKLKIAIMNSPHSGASEFLTANDIRTLREKLEAYENELEQD